MGRYFDVIGDGASGIVFDGDGTGNVRTTIGSVWSNTTSTVLRINGERIDMTDAPTGERREVDGYVLVRTETGVKVRDRRR